MFAIRYIPSLFGGDLAQLPAQLAAMEQAGYLQTSFQEYLTPINAYASRSDYITFEEYEEHRGSTITKTRPGLKAPIQTVTDPAIAQSGSGGLDNGVSPTDVSIEQYTLAPGTYQDGMNLDLIGTNIAIVNRFAHNVKTNVIQAGQTLEVLARNTLLSAYMAGCATVITASTALTTTPAASIDVDDIRGLSTTIVNGVVSPVSSVTAYQLPATVYPAGSPTGAYAVLISAAAADGSNGTATLFVGAAAGARCNGVSGILSIATVSGSQTLLAGDVIIAGDAAKQFLPGGKLHWSKLLATDLLTQSQVLDGVAWIRDQGVHPLDDGTYLCILSNRSMRSLYNDADFQQAFRGLGNSAIYKGGKIDEYLGVTFLRTTNAPKIPIGGNGPANGYVHVPLLIGDGALIDASYAGIEYWAANEYQRAYIQVSDKGLAQVITPPMDRYGRALKMSWLTIRDICAPTDVTASSAIIFTAGGSRYKRSVALPHGAGT